MAARSSHCQPASGIDLPRATPASQAAPIQNRVMEIPDAAAPWGIIAQGMGEPIRSLSTCRDLLLVKGPPEAQGSSVIVGEESILFT